MQHWKKEQDNVFIQLPTLLYKAITFKNQTKHAQLKHLDSQVQPSSDGSVVERPPHAREVAGSNPNAATQSDSYCWIDAKLRSQVGDLNGQP